MDKWWYIEKHVHKVYKVSWIKSHRAKQQALDLGFSEEDWAGNAKADDLATQGLKLHQEDHDAIKLYTIQRHTIREIHRHILRQQTWLAEHKVLTF